MPYTLVLVAIIAGYTWLVDRYFDVSGLVPTVLVLAVALTHAARSREWGFRRGAFRRAAWWTGIVTVAAAAVILAAGQRLGTLHDRPGALLDFAYLIFWGGGQQFVLQTVVLHEARQRMPAALAVIVAAAIFAALHLPNPLLTALTGAGALVWCAIYLRAPHLVPLAVSHAVLTLAILHAFDAGLTGGLRIGYAYLTR